MSNPTTSIPKGSQIAFSDVLEAFHVSKVAAFSDVKAKGQRIFDNDLYDIWQMNTYSVLIDVLGDNDVYTVYINDKARVNKYEKNTPMVWQCTCTWADWAFNRETYHGRICSHVYCGYLLLREVKKMSKVANDEENEELLPSQEFDSAESELIFNQVYKEVEDNFEAFYDFVMDDLATHSVSDTITEMMIEHDLDHDEVEDVIKLCLMQVQDTIANSSENHIEQLESQVYMERLEENGVPMIDDDELLESELFDDYEEPKESRRHSRRRSSIKRAGRIFTEEEKIALIEEDGVSWHVLNGMFG